MQRFRQRHDSQSSYTMYEDDDHEKVDPPPNKKRKQTTKRDASGKTGTNRTKEDSLKVKKDHKIDIQHLHRMEKILR